jgi:hypothetical protein
MPVVVSTDIASAHIFALPSGVHFLYTRDWTEETLKTLFKHAPFKRQIRFGTMPSGAVLITLLPRIAVDDLTIGQLLYQLRLICAEATADRRKENA